MLATLGVTDKEDVDVKAERVSESHGKVVRRMCSQRGVDKMLRGGGNGVKEGIIGTIKEVIKAFLFQKYAR